MMSAGADTDHVNVSLSSRSRDLYGTVFKQVAGNVVDSSSFICPGYSVIFYVYSRVHYLNLKVGAT